MGLCCVVVLFLNANCLTFPEILLILTRFCCTMLGAREFARKRPSRGAFCKEMWWFSGDLWTWSLLKTDCNPLRESCPGGECLIISQIRGVSWYQHVFESPILWLAALKLKHSHFISKTSCHLQFVSNKQQDVTNNKIINIIQSKKNMSSVMIIVLLSPSVTHTTHRISRAHSSFKMAEGGASEGLIECLNFVDSSWKWMFVETRTNP